MVTVYVTSAFCKNNKGGNKAGVVLNRSDLSSGQKMEIAKKLLYTHIKKDDILLLMPSFLTTPFTLET